MQSTVPGSLGSERLLTVREVAARLSICTRTVYDLAARGELPHIRILNAIRVEPEALAAYVAARKRRASRRMISPCSTLTIATAQALSRLGLAVSKSMAANEATERAVELHGLRQEHRAIQDELHSLERRRSNVPLRTLELRQRLCSELGFEEEDVPFVAELLQVRIPTKSITDSSRSRSPVPGMAITPERSDAGVPYFAGFVPFVKLPSPFRIDSPSSLIR